MASPRSGAPCSKPRHTAGKRWSKASWPLPPSSSSLPPWVNASATRVSIAGACGEDTRGDLRTCRSNTFSHPRFHATGLVSSQATRPLSTALRSADVRWTKSDTWLPGVSERGGTAMSTLLFSLANGRRMHYLRAALSALPCPPSSWTGGEGYRAGGYGLRAMGGGRWADVRSYLADETDVRDTRLLSYINATVNRGHRG